MLWLFSSLILTTPLVLAEGPYRTLGDIFQNQLASLPVNPHHKFDRADFGYACLLAVNESLEIADGYLEFRPGQTHLRGDVETFQTFQFPCTATYNGSNGDQPQVWVTYSWCHNAAPGWRLTHSDPSALGEWVNPLIAFIVPSVIFCLNVARRRRINVPKQLFPETLDSVFEILLLLYKVPLASLIVSLDTIIWLITIVGMAGPMLLSGIYEAVLDVRILTFIQSPTQWNNMTVRARAHLLLIALLGNLDLNPAWTDASSAVAHLPHDDLRRRSSSMPVANNDTKSPATPIISPTKSSTPPRATTPPKAMTPPPITTTTTNPSCLTPNNGMASTTGSQQELPADICSQIETTKTQLNAMLEAQMSFGSSVGVAVIFYTGSFVYALVEVQSQYGSNFTAYTISFGMFWMIIPHVAIVSSLLLAGNNPSIWEAVSSANERSNKVLGQIIRDEGADLIPTVSALRWGVARIDEGKNLDKVRELRNMVLRPIFKSGYKTAWLWNRGSSKALWLAKYAEEYPSLCGIETEVLNMRHMEWAFSIFAPAFFLLTVPSFLAGMISYTTPAVGLSCRSMTVLIYSCAQTFLMLLWLWDWVFWKRDWKGRVKLKFTAQSPGPVGGTIWYTLFLLAFATSFFTGIFGTVFILMGLYKNCLCFLPIQYWIDRYTSPNATFYLASDSSEQIHNAKVYWMPAGISATVLLVSMTYIGWWYQRHLRAQFYDMVARIGNFDEVEEKSQSNTS